MYKSLIFCLLLTSASAAIAQESDWKWEAPLEAARRSGYQDVPLGPEVICRLNPEYGNLRLIDSAGEEVPYLFFSEGQVNQEVSLKWYPRFREDYWRRWYSRSTFQNPRADAIDRLVLKIRNADVRQTFWLSGSDDMDRWHIVKEDFAYDSDYDPASTYNLITIEFPPVDYKYYKVEIRHRWHEPIQIMGAGYYSVTEKDGNYQQVPRPGIVQREESTKSIVDIHFNAPYYLDRVFFEVDGPEMYHREAVLKRKTSHGGYQTLESFVLDSRSLHLLEFDALRTEAFRLEIENRDDKPLRIAGVQAFQLRKYLTAKLERGNQYALRIGPEGLCSPVYDLTYFGSDLPERRSSVKLQPIKAILPPPPPVQKSTPPVAQESTEPERPASPPPAEEEPAFDNSQVLLWGGIILIVFVLGFMAFRMLREMEK